MSSTSPATSNNNSMNQSTRLSFSTNKSGHPHAIHTVIWHFPHTVICKIQIRQVQRLRVGGMKSAVSYCNNGIFGERALASTFAICHRPSVCHLSVSLSSVMFVPPTQATENFRNVSMPFGTLAICDISIKILRILSQGNPSVGGLNQRGVAKYSDFGLF